MSVLEIKNDLLVLIVKTEDIRIREKLRSMLVSVDKEKTAPSDLAKYEMKMAKQGMEQIREGKTKTHEEARNIIKKHLQNLPNE